MQSLNVGLLYLQVRAERVYLVFVVLNTRIELLNLLRDFVDEILVLIEGVHFFCRLLTTLHCVVDEHTKEGETRTAVGGW